LLITGMFVALAIRIKKHYYKITQCFKKIRRKAIAELHDVLEKQSLLKPAEEIVPVDFDPEAKTAIILVKGYGGTGLNTFLRINENFKGIYRNFIFIRVGVVNSKIYKGSEELDHFKKTVREDGEKYVKIANQFGFYGKSVWTIGTDPVEEVYRMVKKLNPLFPNSTFFGGQLVFSKAFYLSHLLHNHTIFAIQKRFFKFGLPIVIFPIRID